MERVGFSPRLWAYLLDGFLAALGGLFFSLVFGGILGGTVGATVGGPGAGPEGLALGAFLGSLLGAILGVGLMFLLISSAYGLIEALTGRSPGKMLLGLTIRNQDGSRATGRTLFWRYALKNSALLAALLGAGTGLLVLSALANVLYFGFLLGCLAAMNYNHQALHDILMGTAVYRRADLAAFDSPLDTGPQIP